jgi:A/G-specific adenine glycosylase
MKKKSDSLSKEEKQFTKTVWKHYRANGRHDLPWRKTENPYHILVSELMLQQTQVTRVIPKYKAFLKAFPTARRLAAAPLGDVLRAWQGLGYNRRAKFLWLTAQAITHDCKGKWPTTLEDLRALPGVGSYTAGAVMNFAYNIPVPLIETNIRTVYIHHFFQDREGVSDAELILIVERTLDRKTPREWNWALMDYGTHLKTTIGNLNKKSKTYQKQSNFKESNRYVRGAILRSLARGPSSKVNLFKTLSTIEKKRIELALDTLSTEGLVTFTRQKYHLP